MFALGDALQRPGWFLDRQKPPDCLHATVSAGNAPVIDDFLADLHACVAEVGDSPHRRPIHELRNVGVSA